MMGTEDDVGLLLLDGRSAYFCIILKSIVEMYKKKERQLMSVVAPLWPHLRVRV